MAMPNSNRDPLTHQTIEDFGEQWTRYTTNDGYYASATLFQDICGPLIDLTEIRGSTVADIGSGSGRIVTMLLEAGAQKVVAIEPSKAFEVLQQNTKSWGERVEHICCAGEDIPQDRNLDFVFSIGVLHHIPNPAAVVRAAYGALKPHGKILVWLYGAEGNQLYLKILTPLRKLSTRLPAPVLAGLAHCLNVLLFAYALACRFLPLPLRDYINNVSSKFSWQKRFLVIYDQLNPAYAKYYTGDEASSLLADAGFRDVKSYHRHGYSWTVTGTKPHP
jgi:SAM-dependent methyltransferase